MGIGLVKVLHVKVPVTDLARSVAWYESLLDVELTREFVEEGELRGVALLSREAGFGFALREREFCASQPELTGFDPFALHVSSRKVLQNVIDRCERLGIPHGEIEERGRDQAIVDVPDPDGTVLRFYWPGSEEDDGFVGLDFGADGIVTFYDTPRLQRSP
jgi:catechol 2,3-dioxygenase-like lactoylglutathione lyase family enzyme